MTLGPQLRKLVLLLHVTTSVGWLGAVAAFLPLAITGLVSPDAQLVRASWLSMDLITRTVLVPFSLASLLTGLLSSLGTPWGLLRHYWVLEKLVLSTVATIGLLVHSQPIHYVASIAATTTLSATDLRDLRFELLVDAGAALLVLFGATLLAVYKPRGTTPYGRRRLQEPRTRLAS